jgi:hypothetical protein
MTDTALTIPPVEIEQTGLTRYQPANLKQLVWFAGEVAKSGMYLKTDKDGNQVPMSQAETFMVMSEGVEMGISPITAMRNIYLMEDKRGRKTTIPRADLIAARIQADPRTELWEVEDEVAGTVTVRAKRHNRPAIAVTLELKDIPSRDRDRWAKGYLDTQDMLTNRTIRKIARRHFRDMVLGLGIDQDVDDRRVIDVAAVEREIGEDLGSCPVCGGKLFLQASQRGGAFVTCNACGRPFPPPQEVRDAVRGTPEHLTLAGTAETVLEPGEHELTPDELAQLNEGIVPPAGVIAQLREEFPLASRMVPEHVDANDSAVQSESERDTIDGEDVVAVPASVVAVAAEAPIPVPAAPASNQAMRDAIYQHWIKPRPTANKIEMRGLLDEHGWHGDQSLGDWMLTLTDDQLAKIGDAIKDIP